MTKRKISKQQLLRIKAIQDSYQNSEKSDLSEGLVIARYGRHVLVETKNSKQVKCSIRSNIESITAGDKVMWQLNSENHGIIVSCLPRSSVLMRINERQEERAIAANVTQLMIVIAPSPVVSWPLLDSYLIMAEILNLSACIVLNKTDIVCDEIIQTLEHNYLTLGYPLILSNQNDLEVLNIKAQLNTQVSVFVGQSGVGKSSLIARILPHEKDSIKTASVSESSNLGCHTTRNAKLYHLPSGGSVIDSPGVREFNLGKISIADIAHGYRDFRDHLGLCKYRNCEHITSPGCAILNAVKNNLISRQRYENYVKISTQD